MGRDPATPLRISGDYGIAGTLPSEKSLEQQALEVRPDLKQAEAAAAKSRQQQSLAKKAYVPDFSVSAGYMLMPPSSAMRNTYMVEGSMSLPWLDRRKHDAEVATAAAAVSEQDAELAALRTRAFGQIKESLAEAEAAQKFAALYQNSLRPQAEATLHAAVIAYENNQADFLNLLDSQMQVIDIDVAWMQALADFNSRLADLEMAVGAPISIDATTATPSPQEGNQ